MSIERLILEIQKLNVNIYPEEIADWLWLVAQDLSETEKKNELLITLPTAWPASETSEYLSEIEAKREKYKPFSERIAEFPSNVDNEFEKEPEDLPKDKEINKHKSIYTPTNTNAGVSVHGQSFYAPGARSLPHALRLSQALQPFSHKKTTDEKAFLDEELTIDKTIENGFLTPLFKTKKGRWLEVSLIIDSSPSMEIWNDTLKEFKELLIRQGSFSDVRTWILKTNNSNQNIILLSENGQFTRNYKELVNPNKNRLILIATDCISYAWEGAELIQWINEWGSKHSVNIIQMLPQNLWQQTRLKNASLSTFESSIPIPKNNYLIKPSSSLPLDKIKSSPIPITTLEPNFLKNWALFISGKSDLTAPLFSLNHILYKPTYCREFFNEDEVYERFRSVASPLAFELSCLLAVVPLRLTIIRMVQKALLPKSNQSHLAEFILSSLVKRVDLKGTVESANDIEYEIISDNIKQKLLKDGSLIKSMDVIDIVSGYIAEKHGSSLGFNTLLSDSGSRKLKVYGKFLAQSKDLIAKEIHNWNQVSGGNKDNERKTTGSANTTIDPMELNTYEDHSQSKKVQSKNINEIWPSSYPKIFISYSHKDEAWKDRLQATLAVLEMEGLLSVWEDRQISQGDSWYSEIERALNTADVAILLISAHFLTSQFIQSKEISRLLERREKEGIRIIPLILSYCPWKRVKWLSAIQGATRNNVELSSLTEHEQDSVLSKLAEEVYDLVSNNVDHTQNAHPQSQSNLRIHSDRLPTVSGGFFGREAELKILDDAWQQDSPTRIIQFIAPGGTGKTKLLRHWLDHTKGIDALVAWSFYSQGVNKNKQTSASPFFNHIFKKLGATQTNFDNDEDKGEYLADLLCEQRCVLVLDGLEPMQYADSANRGELKDRALRMLLKSLAGRNTGLCIITTRIAVHELSNREASFVVSHNLENLAPADGVELLQSLGVKGQPAELSKAVNEYGCHALAINLLGNVLRHRYQGDVHKRDTFKELITPTGNNESQHAFKVMQAYAEWFNGEPELDLLYLLGLFDYPIEQEVLRVLWDTQIPNLTAGIDEDDWLEAIARLHEEHHLLSQHDDSNDLDCHPLIREYFGKQLKDKQPNAWQQAHETLYHYYKDLPEKELPDTLDDMQPLFSAVAHGCAAGLHQQVLDEIYWPRIIRKDEYYLTAKYGAFSDDLTVLAHFFTAPWHTPAASLSEQGKVVMLNRASFSLRALGRLREALEPMQAAVNLYEKQENWAQAGLNAGNLSELQLTLGNVSQAALSGQLSMDYADRSGNLFYRLALQATHAEALHQAAGETARILTLLRQAEQLQKEHQPEYPHLYSLPGFRYCDILLAQSSENQNQIEEVLERAEYALNIALNGSNNLLDIALNKLTLGHVHLQQQDFQKTTHWLNQAVTGLRAAGSQPHLPRGLLSRANLHHQTQNFTQAHQDLQEVLDIAEPSGMRLHLTDYHLEMARLLLAEQASEDEVQHHIQAATQLIEATGYNRRLPELKTLRLSIAQ